MKNFDLSFLELESFVAVCTYRNFTKAAEKLYISQSALSRRIKSIEDELGIPLFRRNGTYVELNEAGKYLYKEAQRILQQRDNVYAGMARFSENVAGTLRIAVFSSFPYQHAMYGINTFARKYPDVSITVEAFQRIDVVRYLQEHTIDVGFAFHLQTSDIPGVKYKILRKSQATFLVGKGHPLFDRDELEWSDLRGERLFIANEISKMLDEATKAGVSFSDVVMFRTLEEAALQAATCKGIMISGTEASLNPVFQNSYLKAIPLKGGSYDLGSPVLAWAEENSNPLTGRFCELYGVRDLTAE